MPLGSRGRQAASACLGYVVDEKKAREAPFLNPQVPRLLAISHGLSARAVASGAPRCVQQRGRMRPGNGSLSSADFRGRWKCNSTAVPLRWPSLCHSATLPTFTHSCCCILSSVIDFLCCVVFCCVNTNNSFTHCTVGGHVAPLPFLPFKSEAAAVDTHPCLLGRLQVAAGREAGWDPEPRVRASHSAPGSATWSSASVSSRGLLLLGVLSAWCHRASRLVSALGLFSWFPYPLPLAFL